MSEQENNNPVNNNENSSQENNQQDNPNSQQDSAQRQQSNNQNQNQSQSDQQEGSEIKEGSPDDNNQDKNSQDGASQPQTQKKSEEEENPQTQTQPLNNIQQNLNTEEIISWFKEVMELELNIFDEERYWSKDFDNVVTRFVSEENLVRLVFWVNEEGMQYTFDDPPTLNEKSYDPDFEYFVKVSKKPIENDTFQTQISHNCVKSNYIQTLLKMLDDYYNPKIYSDNSWPENVKKEFIAQMHKLMAAFTEASQDGFTKLYIPKEDLSDNVAATNDKDLLQRLEVILIAWYRQIKEVVNSQDNQTDSENAGPLDEITYWRNREENLSFIQLQLQNPDLQKILKILKLVDSSYVPAFETLTQNIAKATEEAQNNLDYLKSLYEPCRNLEAAQPKQIPLLLPELLNRVRMIWEHSKYYNTTERVSGLLHKISNEIIKRCKSIINIFDMLDGDVEKCMQDLRDSIECGRQWRNIYEKTAALIDKKKRQEKQQGGEGGEKKKWNFNLNSIFAQIDAFVQRCTELSEICEGQLQFAGKGTNSKIPCFGGSRGTEIESILDEIKDSFRKHLDKIRGTDKDKILDVKDSNWHDMFNSFKTGLKDLDVMYHNIINFAFDQVSTVQSGCEMLEAFDYLAKRDSIKGAVSKKAVEVLMFFQNELTQSKTEFDNIKKEKHYLLNIPLHHGKYSGQAIWVRALIERIQKMKSHIDKLYFVPDAVKKSAYELYEQHYSEFKSFITTYKIKDWKETKEIKELEEAATSTNGIGLGAKCLDKPVLYRAPGDDGESKDVLLLESNFDRSLEKLIVECTAWKKLQHIGVVVPNYYDEFTTNHKENLRVLKEYVMLVVRDQNKIIRYMDKLELQFYIDNKHMHRSQQKLAHSLFRGHLEKVNRVIYPGLHKLKWSSKGILEGFVRDCRRACAELYQTLLLFKGNTEKIEGKCNEISQKILIKNDKKQSIELHKYEEEQEKHRREISNKLRNALDDIKKILQESYEPFTVQGAEVQKTWFEYLKVRDIKIEEALKKAVKNSLLDLHQVIGDEKITPSPMFKIYLELSLGEQKEINYSPSIGDLRRKIQDTIAHMSNIFKDFKKMEVIMYEERKTKLEEIRIVNEKEAKANPLASQKNKVDLNMNIDPPTSLNNNDQYYQTNIVKDRDIQKYTDLIPNNLDVQCKELNNHLNCHPFKYYQYQSLYSNSKHDLSKTFLDQAQEINEIRNMIEFIEGQQLEVLKHKTTEEKGCIIIDNTNIKVKLQELLIESQVKFLKSIQKKALEELNDLFNYFECHKVLLKPMPTDIHLLDKNRKTLQKCQEDLKTTEQKLKPINEKFKLLEDYQQQFTEEQLMKKNRMEEEFTDFSTMLDNTDQRNQSVYQTLQSDTMKGLEEFLKEVSDNKVQFEANAPKQVGNLTNDKAFDMLKEFKANAAALRKKESDMQFGFKLFSIVYDNSAELSEVEKEIENLENVWNVKNRWDMHWESVKLIKFQHFDSDKLDDEADDFYTEVNNYPKEMKKWEVVNAIKNNIEQFRQTLPLISMLKQPYMRSRHWVQLQKNFGTVFDYESDSFTLNEIFKVGLLSQADNVREVCEVAREQYKIESALQNIDAKWAGLDLHLEEHKKGYYKIKKVDEIQSTLEDHMGILSAQKTTLFYDHFRDEIEKWEQSLQNILETLDMLLNVQRQWIYLEAIFNSQQGNDNDQKKQLMGDIAKFEKIEKQLQGYMNEIYRDRNAKKQLDKPGFLKDLTVMSQKLDDSKKILFQLLERNRKEFPRFYLLSNDDLFEILGNSKDPDRINKHMLKCFQGIKKLEFFSTQTMIGGGKKPVDNYEVVSLVSPDGEIVRLNPRVPCEYGVEKWLRQVEVKMKESLAKILVDAHKSIKKRTEGQGFRWVSDWISKFPGQLLIVASQITWTRDCTDVLKQLEDKPLISVSKTWKHVREDKNHFINELTKLVRKPGSEVDREKLVALITIEVHAQTIIMDLQKQGINSPQHFEWMKQLRFEAQLIDNAYEVTIYQTNTNTLYGYEYQGNNGRLVVTNLTDRCYMTLTTAMKLHKGGSPQGPAGTGKTESVKDLGKGMGKFVLVFNCQEGLDYKSIGRLFSGLIQSGGWGCFDEFNRIAVEVLSVVAEQMRQIMNALRLIGENPENIAHRFEEEVIPFNKNIGIFITMNPGYAGRSELPDNLKSLFRPMAMMVPDSQLIVEIMLQSEGFKFGKALSVKVDTLYKLMNQQLSKQDHYEFGLRSIKSVLNCAGKIRREKGVEMSSAKDKERDKEAEMEEQNQETMILMRALRDMNLPKFIEQDTYLFNALFNDLFPNIELQDSQNQNFVETIENELKNQGLIPKPEFVTKVIQLYDSKNTRHGNMLVGAALSGKSTCWQTLQKTLNTLNKQDPKRYPGVKLEILNPKSVSLEELFGWVDLKTIEWNDGVLSTMMQRLCSDETNDQKWMILDGPVDTLWIESMNTVLDDNKVLTLLNGDRIQLPPKVGLVFEVEDLSVASPATVSRAGMIYIDPSDVGTQVYLEAWINKNKDEWFLEFWYEMMDKWIEKMFKSRQNCKDLVKCSEINIIQSLCKMMDAFLLNEKAYIGVDIKEKNEIYRSLLEKWFVFSLIWTFGATVDEQGRKIIDYNMRDIDSMFPHSNTVYDYYITNDKNEWLQWEDKINASVWKPAHNMPYHKMLVPTVDSARNRFILQSLIKNKINVLVVGNTGTGKTAVINGVLQDLDDNYTYQSIVFSAQSNSKKTQEQIESKLVQRTKTKMIADGKKLVIFIDDLNMPRKDDYGSQPALELLRQWIDYDGWFDRTSRDIFKYILDVQLVTAMGPPGGGKAVISQRIQSKFNMINFTFPADSQVKRIFQSILTFKFQEFDEEIKPLSENISVATLALFKAVSENFLPTPQKSHYVFNMRDISKVIQGVYMINKFYCDDKRTVFRIWVHECLRVFHDRLIDTQDREEIKKLITDQLEQNLGTNMKECTNDEEEDTIFIDFLEESSGQQIYTEVDYKDRQKMNEYLQESLQEYNKKQKSPMDIVLFEDAISYVCKIHRIIKLGKGHGMLVGEGGSGRHSLTKLSAFIAGYNLWEIQISKNYQMKEFREDIKRWSEQCGFKERPGVFLFSDNQIVNEGFIEDINNILSVGEVPNLFSPKEDYSTIKDKCKREYIKHHNLSKDARIADEDIIEFFFTRVQNNFHLMLCMSKTGDNLRRYCRMYPGLVNNTTIVWYLPWPELALVEVSEKYLQPLTLLQKVIIELPKDEEEEKKNEGEEEEGELEEEEEKTEEELKKEEEERKAKEEEERKAQEAAETEKGFSEEELRDLISKFFSFTHTKVIDLAEEMFRELQRPYFITPSNYIELVKSYTKLLINKQSEYGYEIKKLALGLHKLYQANEKSKQLENELQVLDINLKKQTKSTETLMVKVESENRDASVKQTQVEQRKAQVEKESATIMELKAEADAELNAAKPMLDMANEALEKLDNKSISEIKSFNNPPPGIGEVLEAVMIIKGKDKSWASAKKEMANPEFLKDLKNPELKNRIPQRVLLKIEKITHNPAMDVQTIAKKSEAGVCLWRWVLAMEQYAKAKKDIDPKIVAVNKLQEKLQKQYDELKSLEDNFNLLQQKIKEYEEQLIENRKKMEQYSEESKVLKEKKDRSEKLLDGLQGTQKSWKERKEQLEIEYDYLIGNCLITAALMSYCGPFPAQKRHSLRTMLLQKVKTLKITYSKDYSFSGFLAKPIEFLNWNFKGLPDDQFSRENAVLVMKGNRFPLMIDPQMQANRWVKNTEKEKTKHIKVLDPQTPNYMQTLEQAISFGQVVILQNLDEVLDPQIEPILNKNLKAMAGRMLLVLGADKEIKYDENFRFYMTTKMSNPKYKAEISTKVTLINFTVKEEGLEEQLTSVVIQKMEAPLEKSKNELVRKKADNEQKLRDLDEKILKMLQEAKGSLIDDLELIKALQVAKETEQEVQHQIEAGAKQMKKTLDARNNYVGLARVAAKLFFVINDFALIDNMYQFALESYIHLFSNTITMYMNKSTAVNDSLQDKLQQIQTMHKYEVYKYACRGLFEKDKLLLSIQMAVKLATDIDQEEWNFFLRGSEPGIDRRQQAPNPHTDWISNPAWDSICDLDKSDKIPSFSGLCGAFTHNTKEWKRWYSNSQPEMEPLPGEWDTKCDCLRKMILIKTVRPDRVLFSAQLFVQEKLSSEFVSPPSFDIEELYKSSSKTIPIIFILSPGTDPLSMLQQLAEDKGIPLLQVSLGQGQEKKAKDKINEGARNGNWLFLANCHLSLDFLKDLEKIIETNEQQKNDINDNFRLWLSSAPHPKFPISILQKCVKQTSEPPKGVKASMQRIYNGLPPDKFNTTNIQNQTATNLGYYKKAIFGLTWFHAICIERKRFKNLGWNVVYDFNDSDWDTADNILQMYIDKESEIKKDDKQQNQLMQQMQGGTNEQTEPVKSPPWEAIQYLISEVTYGGRVTDDRDRKLLNVYAKDFLNNNVIMNDKHKLAECDAKYFVPDNQTTKELKANAQQQISEPKYYSKHIGDFPYVEKPEAFGQHLNAEISSQQIQSNELINSIISLSPKIGGGGGLSREEQVSQTISDLQEKMPPNFEMEDIATRIDIKDTSNPLKVVLLQEISRYNTLLRKLQTSLTDLKKGIQGLVLISEELEKVMDSLYYNHVPQSWGFCYPSIKPLQAWMDDLVLRCRQLYEWAYKGQPNVFWLSGFSFPTGFTTALIQQSARKFRYPVDCFHWEYVFCPYETHLSMPAKEGAYVEGLFLEGAKWDGEKVYITEPEPMKLYCPMPIIHFKPVYYEGKVKKQRVQSYECPCYYYPIRTGTRERPSYMFSVQLPMKPNPSLQPGESDTDIWIKKGTALLLSLGE